MLPLPLLLPLLLLLPFSAAASPAATYLVPPDAASLLSFKAKADSDNKLFYALNERFDYCQWRGVKCSQGRVVRFVLASSGLRGSFPPATLSRLSQLRVLSLYNNSLSGPVPDLSPLVNLKSLFLGRNLFCGNFPPSILFLHRLTMLDLSYNNFTGAIPVGLTVLDRLTSLRLERNRFNGTLPPLNQSFLEFFNVSGNNLTGPIPLTPTLSKFNTSSFSLNPELCGEIVNKACSNLRSPFFDSPSSTNDASSTAPLSQSAQAQGGGMVLSPPSPGKHKKTTAVFGFAFGTSMLILSIVCVSVVLVKKQRRKQANVEDKQPVEAPDAFPSANSTTQICDIKDYPESVVTAKSIEIETQPVRRTVKSGNMVFCGEEIQMYTLEQLMRASAELLGRGSIGTTYKANLGNQLILTVKRIDASKTAVTSNDSFGWHMEAVGGLRHPNLVPVLAYFQAKGERLVIYEYQPNGSLFNLIHGSRSTRAKPLHWTSCLKIAEDVAQGLAYIHQTSNLVHGNLKSSNILLGPDFEARITDYCLAALAATGSTEDDPDSTACKAPETRNSSRKATRKSDVYAYGVLLLELLSGKRPSQHPYMAPSDMLDWVRAVREDDGGDDNRLEMLTEVASVCSLTSPEQRPMMWQVLKMIHEIKESVAGEGNSGPGYC